MTLNPNKKELYNLYKNRQERNHVEKPLKTATKRFQQILVRLDKKSNLLKVLISVQKL